VDARSRTCVDEKKFPQVQKVDRAVFGIGDLRAAYEVNVFRDVFRPDDAPLVVLYHRGKDETTPFARGGRERIVRGEVA
jgi:hypothetical protein